MTPARPFGQGFGTMSSPAMGTGFAPAPMGTGTPFGGAPMTTGTPFGQPGGMGGMGGMSGQMPLQNPPTMGPMPSPTSQPQTMQDMIARAQGLVGTQYGGGMGQPYISDTGYFGPGTMSNPTGPQYGGQGAVNTQVARPLTDVPQYGGQGAVNTQVARPLTDVPQYGGGMGGAGQGPYQPGMQPMPNPYGTTTQQDIMGGGGTGQGMPPSPQLQPVQQQVDPRLQRYQDVFSRQMQGLDQQMQKLPQMQQLNQLSQQYSGQPPTPEQQTQMQRLQQQLTASPQFQRLQQRQKRLNDQMARRTQQYGQPQSGLGAAFNQMFG